MRGDYLITALRQAPLSAARAARARALAARRAKTTFRLPALIPTLERMRAGARRLAARAEVMGLDPRPLKELQVEAKGLIRQNASYAASVRAAARFALAADVVARQARPDLPAIFRPKAQAELEYLLALAPHVFVIPTFAPLSIGCFLRARPVPVHFLGLVEAPVLADNQECSPAEFFFHDVDHARFLVREDLLALGYEIPDAYLKTHADRPASTYDEARGRHRTIMDHAVPVMAEAGPELWRRVGARAAWALELLGQLKRLARRDANLAAAARILLFEIWHEKGFPADPVALETQLRSVAHPAKIAWKVQTGFWGPDELPPPAARRVDEARRWLQEQ